MILLFFHFVHFTGKPANLFGHDRVSNPKPFYLWPNEDMFKLVPPHQAQQQSVVVPTTT